MPTASVHLGLCCKSHSDFADWPANNQMFEFSVCSLRLGFGVALIHTQALKGIQLLIAVNTAYGMRQVLNEAYL